MSGPALLTFLIIAAAFVIVVRGLHQEKTILQQAIGTVQTRLEQLTEEVSELKREQEGNKALPQLTEEKVEVAKLVRLSVQVAQILKELDAAVGDELACLTRANIPFAYSNSTKRTDYVFSGYGTPRSALESAIWAITNMDAKAYSVTLTGKCLRLFARQCRKLPDGVMPGEYANCEVFNATGFRVLEEDLASQDEVHLKVFLEGIDRTFNTVFLRIGADWKLASMAF